MLRSIRNLSLVAATVALASSAAHAGFIQETWSATHNTGSQQPWIWNSPTFQPGPVGTDGTYTSLRCITDVEAVAPATDGFEFGGQITSDPTFDLLQRVKNNSATVWTGFVVTITAGANSFVSNLVGHGAGVGDSLTTNFPSAVTIGNQIYFSGGTVPVGSTVFLDLTFDVDVLVGLEPGTHFSYTIDNTPLGANDTPPVVPEPSHMGLLLGAMGLISRRRRA